jgi:DNA-binding cell septation regulator SpoVG
MENVEIIDIKPLDAGNIRALVSIRLFGVVVIYGAKIIQQPGQKAWLALPSREFISDGQKRYSPVVEITGPLKDAVWRAVLASWQQQEPEDKPLKATPKPFSDLAISDPGEPIRRDRARN